MGAVEQFATCAKSITELSLPFRKALMERVSETEDLRHLIFSPSYGTANFRALASVLCVTSRRWLIVLCQDDGNTMVAECSYDSTLLVELTLILLSGQLKIDFVQDGDAKSAALHFNSIMQDMYSEAIQYILDAIGRQENVGVCWKEVRGGFGRELFPAAAVLVTDRHILVIAEEKSSRWFQFRHDAKYGAIITYFPLNRLADFRIAPNPRFCILELYGDEGHGGERLDIAFPTEKREAVSEVMGKTNPDRLAVSPESVRAKC